MAGHLLKLADALHDQTESFLSILRASSTFPGGGRRAHRIAGTDFGKVDIRNDGCSASRFAGYVTELTKRRAARSTQDGMGPSRELRVIFMILRTSISMEPDQYCSACTTEARR